VVLLHLVLLYHPQLLELLGILVVLEVLSLPVLQ
jgi:hypothetical protein